MTLLARIVLADQPHQAFIQHLLGHPDRVFYE